MKRISSCLRFLLLAIATAFLPLLFVACTQAPLPPLRVGTNLWLGYEPLLIAQNLGYFDKLPIQLVEYSGVRELDRAFQNKAIDLSTTTLDTTLPFAESNPDLRVFLALDVSQGADAVLAQPSIQTAQALKGRKIGLEPSPPALLVLTRMLEKAGLSRQDVKLVTLEFSKQEAAFSQKAIDALVTYEPTRSKLLTLGGKLIFDSKQMPGEIVDVLIGDEKLLTTHKLQLQMLATGWFRALDYMQKYPEKAASLMAKRQQMTREQLSQSLQGIRFINLAENQKLLSKADPTLLKGTKRLSQFLMANQLLKQAANPESLLSDQVVKDLKDGGEG